MMRRDIGQAIVAAGMTDDAVGWMLLSIVLGLAASGEIRAESGKTITIPSDGITLTGASASQFEITSKPSGSKTLSAGQTVSVHYSGWLTDGSPFDSSRSPTWPGLDGTAATTSMARSACGRKSR